MWTDEFRDFLIEAFKPLLIFCFSVLIIVWTTHRMLVHETTDACRGKADRKGLECSVLYWDQTRGVCRCESSEKLVVFSSPYIWD